MNPAKVRDFVNKQWDEQVVPRLTEYIKIPCKSPLFDAQWAEHGHIDRAVDLMTAWAKTQRIAGMTIEVVRLEGRTPLIFIDIPGEGDDCVVLYGHLDKQPEMTGWAPHLGPWTPVLEGDKLFGRGGGDDGYAIFGSLTALAALEEQGVPRSRCVVMIEACEESGSYDLPYYVEHLAGRIGKPSLVVCLDAGCGNYDQLWLTTSLRGMCGGSLRVQVLDEGVHSGDASGVVASSFRIIRQLLSRLEDETTGKVKPKDLYVEIPAQRLEEARRAADALGEALYSKFPFADGTTPVSGDLTELTLNRTWRPTLSITGADGLPALQNAGNVLRPFTAVKVSMRLPPTLDGAAASERVKRLLEADPPYGAKVTFEAEKPATGWNAPAVAPWLERSLDGASREFFGRPPALMGEGGTIPFMGMLGARFPEAQFLITGVLGPRSNAHGPNEFLHVPTGKRVTMIVAQVVADHFTRSR